MKYERLTERDEFGNADVIDVDTVALYSHLTFADMHRVTGALNRLAELEDKIERGELIELPKCAIILTPEEKAEEMRLAKEERKQAVKEFAEVKILIPSSMADKIDELVKEAYEEWKRY